MTDNESPRNLRRLIARRLSRDTAEVPQSSLSRLQHASSIAAQGGFRRLVRALPGTAPSADADRAAASRAVLSLGRLKGVPMKVGQLAGFLDSQIPEELRPAFSALENQAQPMPIRRVRALLTSELGSRAGDLGTALDARPIAVASIGQVHRGELDGVPVAVKLRHPGIEQAIRLDFGPAALGAQATAMFRRKGRRGDALMRQIMERFLEECAYLAEAKRQTAFARTFEEHPVIGIPEVFSSHSTNAVLTTAFVEGRHLDDYLAMDPSPKERQRAGIALFDFYVGSLFVTGAYNSDPHPGNFLFTADDGIVVVDHGSGRTFAPDAVAPIRALARATLADDRRAMRQARGALASVVKGRRLNEDALYRILCWLFCARPRRRRDRDARADHWRNPCDRQERGRSRRAGSRCRARLPDASSHRAVDGPRSLASTGQLARRPASPP